MILDATGLAQLVAALLPSRQRTDVAEGTHIGTTDSDHRVMWPFPSAEDASSAAVFAASGSGKTVVVSHVVTEEFIALHPQGYSAICIDPKGDFGYWVPRALAHRAPGLLDRLVVLAPFRSQFSFGLAHADVGDTPLDIVAMQFAELVDGLSTARGGQAHLRMGVQQIAALQPLLTAALAATHPQRSLHWALDALTTPKGTAMLGALCPVPSAQRTLRSLRISDSLKASTASRLRTAIAPTKSVEQMLAAPSCIPLKDVVAPGKLVVVDLSSPPGAVASITTFFALVMVNLFVNALMQRSTPWTGPHTRIIADEAHLLSAVQERVELVLTTGRSRGTSITLITQDGGAQLDPGLVRVLLSNAPTRLFGRLSAVSAAQLSKELTPSPGVTTPLGTLRSRWLSQITNLPARTFLALQPGTKRRMRSIDLPITEWEVAGDRYAAELAAAEQRYAPPPDHDRITLSDAAKSAQGRGRKTRARRNEPGRPHRGGGSQSATKKRRGPWG